MKAKRPVTPADILLSAGVFVLLFPYVYAHGHVVPALTAGGVMSVVLLTS